MCCLKLCQEDWLHVLWGEMVCWELVDVCIDGSRILFGFFVRPTIVHLCRRGSRGWLEYVFRVIHASYPWKWRRSRSGLFEVGCLVCPPNPDRGTRIGVGLPGVSHAFINWRVSVISHYAWKSCKTLFSHISGARVYTCNI